MMVDKVHHWPHPFGTFISPVIAVMRAYANRAGWLRVRRRRRVHGDPVPKIRQGQSGRKDQRVHGLCAQSHLDTTLPVALFRTRAAAPAPQDTSEDDEQSIDFAEYMIAIAKMSEIDHPGFKISKGMLKQTKEENRKILEEIYGSYKKHDKHDNSHRAHLKK